MKTRLTSENGYLQLIRQFKLQFDLTSYRLVSETKQWLPTSNFFRYEFHVQDGDVIVMATDGIFDNVPDSLLVAEINTIQGSTDPAKIQV